MHDYRRSPLGWGGVGRAARAAGAWALAASALGGCATFGGAVPGRSDAIYGNVFAVIQGDTVPVEGAAVWTEPAVADAKTDAKGYFRLEGLVPQTYTILAEAGGGGRRGNTTVQYVGGEVRAAIILGVRQTEWPPRGGKLGDKKTAPPLRGRGVMVVPPGS